MSVVRAYVYRALSHCSSWPLVSQELKHIKQLLANNHYPAAMIDEQIRIAMDKYIQRKTTHDATIGTTYKLYYRNTMTPAWKMDEKVLRKIIRTNCAPTNREDQLQLNIYYRTPSTASMIMSNNPNRDRAPLKRTNVVYFYKCTKGDCALLPKSGYVGLTTTSLSRRITMHLQNGGPRTHTERTHPDSPLTRRDMVDNTKIIAATSDSRRLSVLEAILIRHLDPKINSQVNATGTLQLYDGPSLTNL